MAYLEALGREELARAAWPHAATVAVDPLLACMDWDLGVAGRTTAGGT